MFGQNARLKLLLGAIVCGFCASLASGTINNEFGMGLPEIRHYGYPLAWLMTDLNGPTEYVILNFAIDAAFWITISLVTFIFLERIVFPNLGIDIGRRTVLLLIMLFVPFGLIMDFVHESGHVIWGTAAGGQFTYMKIAYLEIYPRLAITPEFQLGLARVEGLTYGSVAYGLTLLGGSLATSIASWVLGLILLKMSLGNNVLIALKFLGFFGILDLPFYVVFPQLGLGHWIFLGGCEPEPLTGSRMIGIPDPAFYVVVAFSTFGLVLLYSKTLRENILNRINALLPVVNL